jgi:tetratricopeptide (TPR) repeat protein
MTPPDSEWTDLINFWESQIQAGWHGQVSKQLRKLWKAGNLQKAPRPHLYKIAQVCFRVDQALIGINLLRPWVRPSERRATRLATDEEKTEYASCLLRVGGTREAFRLLDSVVNYPRANFIAALGAMEEWDYKKALTNLRNYIKNKELTPYEKLIADTNVSACLMTLGSFDEASILTNRLIQTCLKNGQNLLAGNLYEIQAQGLIETQNYAQAEKNLSQALNQLKNVKGPQEVYIKKWKAVIRLKKEGFTHSVASDLKKIHLSAKEVNDYETLRDMDFQIARVKPTQARVNHLVHGTAYPALINKYKTTLTLDANEAWWWSVPKNNSFRQRSAIETDPHEFLKPGTLLHKVFLALCSDLYRPPSLLKLYSDTYYDNYFNPKSSPLLISQAIHRLKEVFKKNNLPIIVRELKSHYWLETHSPIKIKKRLGETSLNTKKNSMKKMIEDLFRSYGNNLTCSQVLAATGMPPRSAKRFLSQAVEDEMIKRQGKGRGVYYRR